LFTSESGKFESEQVARQNKKITGEAGSRKVEAKIKNLKF
jgi:hypothetical protein